MMRNKSIVQTDRLKTLSALNIMVRALASDQKDQEYWNNEARKLVPGWSFVNCVQWLNGRKCLDSFAQIKDADLAALNLNTEKSNALIVVAQRMCVDLGLGNGRNHKR